MYNLFEIVRNLIKKFKDGTFPSSHISVLADTEFFEDFGYISSGVSPRCIQLIYKIIKPSYHWMLRLHWNMNFNYLTEDYNKFLTVYVF